MGNMVVKKQITKIPTHGHITLDEEVIKNFTKFLILQSDFQDLAYTNTGTYDIPKDKMVNLKIARKNKNGQIINEEHNLDLASALKEYRQKFEDIVKNLKDDEKEKKIVDTYEKFV